MSIRRSLRPVKRQTPRRQFFPIIENELLGGVQWHGLKFLGHVKCTLPTEQSEVFAPVATPEGEH